MLFRRNRIIQLCLTFVSILGTLAFLDYLLISGTNTNTYQAGGGGGGGGDTANDGGGGGGTKDYRHLQEYIQQVTGVSLEGQLSYRYVELSNRLRYAEMMAKQRRLEVNYLMSEVKRLAALVNNNNIDDGNNSNKDVITTTIKRNEQISEVLHLPTLFSLVPHLAYDTAQSLDPAFRLAPKADSRRPARFVFGIPTVKREVESYLLSTLRNLVDNLNPLEKEQAIFVVMIAETNQTFVQKIVDDLKAVFGKEIDTGLIELISPPAGLYFEPDKLVKTLDDPMERVQWRSKQNLDFAYLMMYAQSKGVYYVQLEDDIISKPSYLMKMEAFITKKTLSNPDWVVLDFCALGFIGKLFKTTDLPKLIVFFGMFFNDKPVDWLLDHYMQNKVCRFDRNFKDCKQKKSTIWIAHKPSLFQHVGTHSSLKGKIQKLRDRGFGRVKAYTPHFDNPPASSVHSTFKHYQRYSLEKAYNGHDFFWAPSAKPGDELVIDLLEATALEMCLIRTGSVEHPEDIFFNASLLVKPAEALSRVLLPKYHPDDNGFVVLDHFDPNRGLVQALVPAELNPIKTVRIVSQQNSSHWILISEIYLKPMSSVASSNALDVLG